MRGVERCFSPWCFFWLDTNVIHPCLSFYLLSSPCLDPANLTGKQTLPITIYSVLQGYFPWKAFANNALDNRSQESQDYCDVSLMIV